MTADVLTLRQLNRATLARQLLLERAAMSALDAIRHLVGLQAQEPPDPFIGLWSRLAGFSTDDLDRLLLDRAVVRLTVQRGTMHAVTAEDCLVLRPLAQPVLTQQMYTHQDYRGAFEGVDLDAVLAYARELLAESPRSTKQLRTLLGGRFPDHDAAAMAFACRNRLPFIQVPPRGLWATPGEVIGTTPEAWLGRPISEAPDVDDVIVRYLAAFGPATVQDAATWSRYNGLRQVFERVRPRLRTYRDEDGKEYFDVPDGPIAEEDVPAPVRFLPQFDNLLLSHADRRRFTAGEDFSHVWLTQTKFLGTVLVDGTVAGAWSFNQPTRVVQTGSKPVILTITTKRPLPGPAADDVLAEAERFAAFVSPGSVDIRVAVGE